MTAYGAVLTVSHATSSVRRTRHAVAAQLTAAGVTDVARDDVLLVLSELVSNAIRHAEPLPSGNVQVAWSLTPDDVHLEVTDGGSTTFPRATAATLSALGGRGLDIVRAISHRWGVTEGTALITVWADVPRNAQERSDP